MKRVILIGLVVFVVAFLVRVAGLGYPNQVVFDEVHFGKFMTAYCCTGEHFFDIHPPHGKLLLAAGAKLAGYDGGFSFENIGQEYTEDVPVVGLRMLPAVVGAMIPLVVFVLLLQLGANWKIAGLGSLVLAFDNALVVQSRLVSLDNVLILSTFTAISLYLWGGKSEGKKRWVLFGLAGVMAGLAAGTKLTGLTALGVLGVLTGIDVVKWLWLDRKRALKRALEGLLILGVAVLVYWLGWAIHDALLVNPGPGDAFYQRDVSIFKKHEVMFHANYNLTATHPYASLAATWPILLRTVFYWSGAGGGLIYLLGNPVVWWGSLLGLALGLVGMLVSLASTKKKDQINYLVPVVGYVIAYLPLLRVSRALFLYHYFTPFIFGVMIGALWLNVKAKSAISLWVILGFVVLGFIVFSPLTYGFSGWSDNLFILKSWR